ncbi:MAG: tetratricopeptide repeat protein [Kiritimatiellia bacterium]
MNARKLWFLRVACVGLACLLATEAPAQRAGRAGRRARGEGGAEGVDAGEIEASRFYSKACELLEANDEERGIRMLENILEQFPASRVRYQALIALGKHYIGKNDQGKAIAYLNQVKAIEQPDTELGAADRELLLESLYLMGTAYFNMRQYGAAFPILRRITTQFPNSVWANQSYYYIGMCHFAQGNWSRAIDSLSMVGTFIDADSQQTQVAEAGHRFYVKIQDADLPILFNLGKKIAVTLETSRGDVEEVECFPLTSGADVFIGSIPTEIGTPKPGDNLLSVTGGDTIKTVYVDATIQDGTPDVRKEAEVKVVSTASATFTLGDHDTEATAAFLDQPLFILVQDADCDLTEQADTLQVRVVSRFKAEDDDDIPGNTVDLSKLMEDQEEKYEIRDEVTLLLTELGTNDIVRTGRFGGSVKVVALVDGVPVERTDDELTAAIDDEIVLTYVDNVHIDGSDPRLVECVIPTTGAIDTRPRATQDVVSDPVVRSKKILIEAAAYLELGRIFRSMGLMDGAKDKVKEGLDRVDSVVRMTLPIPAEVRQEAFRLKWELHLVVDDFHSAMAACRLFNSLYPDSPFVDQALMGIAKIRLENKEYDDAIGVFNQVLALQKSMAKAEAQFRIAECIEAKALQRISQYSNLNKLSAIEPAIQTYKLCAERYPESEFAGQSLAKVIDYHIDMKDYGQAGELLQQIFQDYPDASFLDVMLLKWVLVAYRGGDFQKAYDKASQLIFEYPASSYAEKAREILPRIEARLKK